MNSIIDETSTEKKPALASKKQSNLTYLSFLLAEVHRAPTLDLHNHVFGCIQRLNPPAALKLKAITPEVYAMYTVVRDRIKTLGTLTSNDAEQEMMRLKRQKVRVGKPLQVFQNIFNLWRRLISEAAAESNSLLMKNSYLTEYAHKKITARMAKSDRIAVDIKDPLVTYALLTKDERDEVNYFKIMLYICNIIIF